ncbi:MFS transporter [Lederbergia wuyishanensis]|uniref:PPP family 3-phenylpropionic acid transporter n=1 Tax=Lederbergia wuyishanensis TaxID=1347903 RepID=A0ABU0D3Q5_9BACI|nr:MFS transporter [Lederbergia wuyishanensis]MCJ8007792.1 MFS transporter [Lederbergia wuyishanensis]MDQ0343045.1 PPP family 3-phenylpropionic acid transporter [Lederbergia wuyishanensis]
MINTSDEHKRGLMTVKLFNFFLYGALSVLMSFIPLYFQEVGFTTVAIGMLMAGGPFVSIFANPFWGYWSDRLQNIKKILLIMLIGNLIIIQIVFQLNSLPLVFIAMLLFFNFQTPLFSQSNSLILNTIEGTPYKFGTFRLWGSLGWAIMAVGAGPLINVIGIKNLWLVYSFMLILTILFGLKLPQGKVEGSKKLVKGGYAKALFGNKYFLVFVILGVLISVPNSINLTFISLYIKQLGGSVVMIGWSAFLTAIFEVPVFLLFDRYLKRNTSTMIGCLVVISGLFVIRWFLMSIATDPMQVLFLQMLHSVTFGGYFYIGTTLTAKLVPVELRASGQAIYGLTWGGISGIIAGMVGGWMFQELGPNKMYQITMFISLLGVFGFAALWLSVSRAAKQKVSLEGSEKNISS